MTTLAIKYLTAGEEAQRLHAKVRERLALTIEAEWAHSSVSLLLVIAKNQQLVKESPLLFTGARVVQRQR
jgi:hypothetical protein